MTACPAYCCLNINAESGGHAAFWDLGDVQSLDRRGKLWTKPDPVHGALSIFCLGEAEWQSWCRYRKKRSKDGLSGAMATVFPGVFA